MLDQICRHIRNYFVCVEMHEGDFTIENGNISLPFANNKDYILIEGSRHNDGIIQWESTGLSLTDEEFHGFISVRAIPREFEDLVTSITTFNSSNGAPSNLTSESFGGYSYTKATGSNGLPADWQTVFRERLNLWRKI